MTSWERTFYFSP